VEEREEASTLAVRLRLRTPFQTNRLAWPHRRRGLASDGVRYAGARSSVGRRFRSVTKLRLEYYGGVFLFLQQRSKHPREMVITPKASTPPSTYPRLSSPSVTPHLPSHTPECSTRGLYYHYPPPPYVSVLVYLGDVMLLSHTDIRPPSGIFTGPPPTLAYTRYSFNFFCVCKNQSSLSYPPPICITPTTATLLRDFCAIYAPPTDPPFICHAPYNIGDDNIV